MTTRDRTVLGFLCLLAVIVAPWLLVVQPKRDQAASLQSQISAAQSQLNSVRAQLAVGTAARAAFASSYATLVRLGEAVPTTDDTPSLIYEIQAAAKSSGVNFQGLTLTATSTGSTAASTATATSVAGPTSEPVTLTFQGNFFHLANFVGRLQRFVVANDKQLAVSGRLMTLNEISLGPGGAGFPQMAATITATMYLLPASEALHGGATPSGPAGSSSQTVSTSQAGSPAPPAVVTPPVR